MDFEEFDLFTDSADIDNFDAEEFQMFDADYTTDSFMFDDSSDVFIADEVAVEEFENYSDALMTDEVAMEEFENYSDELIADEVEFSELDSEFNDFEEDELIAELESDETDFGDNDKYESASVEDADIYDNDESLDADDAAVVTVQEEYIPDVVMPNIAPMPEDSVFSPIFKVFEDIYNIFTGESTDLVTKSDFSADGTIDLKNNLIVEGNVASDLQYIDQQTGQSCSLMAQEQFVHRYTGQSIPEEYLEWQAEKWGVYDPDLNNGGTNFFGQTMILDHFNIPHGPHESDCDIEDLNDAISAKEDIIICVDAREFYDNPNYPPDSGHAVTITGRARYSENGEIAGYYVTDSNCPQAAHFVSVEKLQRAWYGDMITVPEKTIA